MLSNPSPESSVGKFLSARNSMASRSRIVFVYSALFKRLAVTRPGSGFIAASARANSFSRNFTSVADLLVGPKHILGRHLLRLELRENRIPPIAIGGERLHGRVEGTSSPPARSVELWHSLQVSSNNDLVAALNAAGARRLRLRRTR